MLIPLLAMGATPAPPDEEMMRQASGRNTSFLGSETSLILGGVLVVAAIVFFWAVFLRKRPQTQRGSQVITRARPENKERFGASGRRRRRKRRPDHPDNMPRNPTLAEIGGLPPLRPDEPEPPSDQGSAPSHEAQR